MGGADFAKCYCLCCMVLLLIVVIWYFIGMWWIDLIYKEILIEKAQNKCKEYVDLACKFKSVPTVARIMNGTRALRGEFPHQVYLSVSREDDFSHTVSSCGGSIISERFVLTAAHCTSDPEVHDIVAIIGTLDAQESNKTLIRKIKKTHKHPDYKGVPPIGDVAVLELEKKLEFNSDVRPICLNTKFEKNYKKMIATGWGRIEGGDTSRYLNKVELQGSKEADKRCSELKNLTKVEHEYFNKTGICLAHVSKGIHKGDSGGPLQVKYPSKCENTWEQIGITAAVDSLGDYKGKELTASLFVKVDYYLPWIANIVWSDQL